MMDHRDIRAVLIQNAQLELRQRADVRVRLDEAEVYLRALTHACKRIERLAKRLKVRSEGDKT